MPYSYLKTPEISERIVPFFFVGYAVWIITHFDTVFKNTPAYQKATFMSETGWLLVFGVCGVLQFAATRSGKLKWRRRMLFVSSLAWSVWSVPIILSFTPGFGALTYTSLTAMTVWTWLNTKPTQQPTDQLSAVSK